MKTYEELQTIGLSYQEICEGEDPWIPLGNFMNDFFGNYPERRAQLVMQAVQEPETTTPELHQWAVFCAAAVEYLAEKYELVCPEWVYRSSYAGLDEPWYHSPGAHKPTVRERLARQTPEAFARRNIFCGNRVFANKYEAATQSIQRRSA